MDRDRRLSLTVGGFVLAALGAFALAVLSLSSQEGVWVPRYRLVSYFENVQGLVGSAPVWLAGKRVGRVESVAFGAPDSDRPAVQVVLQIDEGVQERIRSDSVATIGTLGLLGDRYVEVSFGTAAGRVLEDGDEIESVSPVDLNVMVEKGARTLDSIASLATRVDEVMEDFSSEMGGQKLAGAMAAVSDIVEEIQTGDGLLHSLIYDQYEGGGVESVEHSLASLEDILTEIRHGDGIMHSLIYDTPTEQNLLLEAFQVGSRLNSILAKIDRGEGTFGLMLNDPTLYEELKVLVGGANRSRVVRTMIRLAGEGDEE
ncbi:MAG: MlaD family protein [Myxococcota bacterium]